MVKSGRNRVRTVPHKTVSKEGSRCHGAPGNLSIDMVVTLVFSSRRSNTRCRSASNLADGNLLPCRRLSPTAELPDAMRHQNNRKFGRLVKTVEHRRFTGVRILRFVI